MESRTSVKPGNPSPPPNVRPSSHRSSPTSPSPAMSPAMQSVDNAFFLHQQSSAASFGFPTHVNDQTSGLFPEEGELQREKLEPSPDRMSPASDTPADGLARVSSLSRIRTMRPSSSPDRMQTFPKPVGVTPIKPPSVLGSPTHGRVTTPVTSPVNSHKAGGPLKPLMMSPTSSSRSSVKNRGRSADATATEGSSSGDSDIDGDGARLSHDEGHRLMHERRGTASYDADSNAAVEGSAASFKYMHHRARRLRETNNSRGSSAAVSRSKASVTPRKVPITSLKRKLHPLPWTLVAVCGAVCGLVALLVASHAVYQRATNDARDALQSNVAGLDPLLIPSATVSNVDSAQRRMWSPLETVLRRAVARADPNNSSNQFSQRMLQAVRDSAAQTGGQSTNMLFSNTSTAVWVLTFLSSDGGAACIRGGSLLWSTASMTLCTDCPQGLQALTIHEDAQFANYSLSLDACQSSPYYAGLFEEYSTPFVSSIQGDEDAVPLTLRLPSLHVVFPTNAPTLPMFVGYRRGSLYSSQLQVSPMPSMDNCIALSTSSGSQWTLCRETVIQLLASLSSAATPGLVWSRVTSSVFAVASSPRRLDCNSGQCVVSVGGLSSTLSEASFFLVRRDSMSSSNPLLSDACIPHVDASIEDSIWIAVPIVTALIATSAVFINSMRTRHQEDIVLKWMAHVTLLSRELGIQDYLSPRRKSTKSSPLPQSSLSGSFDSPPDIGDKSPDAVLYRTMLTLQCEEARWYAHFVPSVREKFEYYRSFLPKTASSTFRLPLILPLRSRLSDSGNVPMVPPLGGQSTGLSLPRMPAPVQLEWAHHPSVVVLPASPDGAALPGLEQQFSGMYNNATDPCTIDTVQSVSQAGDSGGVLTNRTNGAGTSEPPPPLPPNHELPGMVLEDSLNHPAVQPPRAPIPPAFRLSLPNPNPSGMNIFTPRAPPPRSISGSPGGGGGGGGGNGGGGNSPVLGSSAHGSSMPSNMVSANPSPSVHELLPLVSVTGAFTGNGGEMQSSVAQQMLQRNLNIAQSQCMSIGVSSTAFLNPGTAANKLRTPRLMSGATPADASLLSVPGHRGRHFHSHHTPRPSYAATAPENFANKRATVLTCSARFRSAPSMYGSPIAGGDASPRDFDAGSAHTFDVPPSGEVMTSPRVHQYRTFGIESQRFLKTAIECAEQCDGSVIEMTTHSVTVCWNALSPYPFHEVRGLQCGMHMAAQLDEHCPDATYHIGVVTGGVLVGYVGTSRTIKQCVLGLAVCISQLLPSLGRLLNCSILVSEATYFMARTRMTCVPIDVAVYDGQAMILYEALGAKEEALYREETLQLVHRGFAALCSGQFKEARGYYEELIKHADTSSSLTHADAQMLRLARVARYLEEEEGSRRLTKDLLAAAEAPPPPTVTYARNGPAWLVHEVAAEDVRLPDDVLEALGEGPAAPPSCDETASVVSSRPHTPTNAHGRSPGSSRRPSVNPIFELRAELERQLLEKTVRASAQSINRSFSSNFQLDDVLLSGDGETMAGSAFGDASTMWSPNKSVGDGGDPDATDSDLVEIVDRRGQLWRRSNKRLGKGTFGEVYVGLQSDGSLCAMKMVTLPAEALMMQKANSHYTTNTNNLQSAQLGGKYHPAGGTSEGSFHSALTLDEEGARMGPEQSSGALKLPPLASGNGSFHQNSLSMSDQRRGSNTSVISDDTPPASSAADGSRRGSGLLTGGGLAPPPSTPMDQSLCSPRLPPTSVLSKEVDQLLQEVATLSSVKSDNVVRYYGSAVYDGAICIVMEYVGGGSLTNMLNLFGSLPIAAARRYTMDILRGLKALHEKRIVHRDIGPNNVLVTIDGTCKLSDFGCSQSLHRINRSNVAGTPQYMSPEACRGEGTTASDIWSLGILVHVLLTSHLPYADSDVHLPGDTFVKRLAAMRPSSSTTTTAAEGTTASSLSSQNPSIQITLRDSEMPSDAREFIQVCLLRDYSLRPTAEQLMLHPFVLK